MPQSEQKTAARVPDPANTTTEDAILSGLSLTEDQKAKIARIHKELRNHVDLVIKDNRNTEDQKEALIEGMRRMERREVFMVLTPEQQQEVIKKVVSKSAAGRKSNTP
jgi:Spy/CpxP family protein refolding chaperone